MHILQTQRLRLIALNMNQLRAYLNTPEKLETELGTAVSREILTDTVRGAIALKLARMERVDARSHSWMTYWLILVESASFGAGLVGYKGIPDHNGAVEIGYGIDPDYQNQGYTTEAVQALIRWAFHQPNCLAVTAHAVRNPASGRVLEKVGMQVFRSEGEDNFWRITKKEWRELS